MAVAAWMGAALPASWTTRLGTWLGRAAYRVSRKHRRRAISNLAMCFPEWDESKVRNVARRVFEHFGKTLLLFFRAGKMKPEEVLASVDAGGVDHLDAALARGKGVILISAHFGNWERMSHYLSVKGYAVSVVVRDANDARLTRLVNRVRRLEGVDLFVRGSAAREILRRLNRNEVVGILPDQNTWEIYVPFFGFPAGTVSGPAVFHLRTGAPILSCFCMQTDGGRYRLEVRPLKTPDLSGDRDEDIKRIMTAVNEALEQMIRQSPEQWLWMHDRWKAARRKGLLDA